MDPLLATLVLILVALLGARLSFSTTRVPAGPRLLFRTGAHFLFLGFLVGPAVLDLMTRDAVAQLQPLLGLGIGWVGLLFGLQWDRDTLARFPLSFYVVMVGQALLAFGIFFGVGSLVFGLTGLEGETPTLLLLGAAATAATSTPAGIAMVSSNFLVRGPTRRFLLFVASLDGVVGIVALQLVYGAYHGSAVLGGWSGPGGTLLWAGVAVGLGVVCGVVFLWLVRLRPAREELVLYLLGISALTAGAALQLRLSPLFACMVMGALISNLSPERERARIFRNLEKWEKPIYVVVLLLAGALLRFPTWWLAPLALGYAAVRALGKVLGTAVLVQTVPLPFSPPRRLGLGLLPQGGISLVMALSLTLTLEGAGLAVAGLDAVDLLFAAVALGVVLSELLGPLATVQVLRRAGEISPRVEKALEEGDQERAHAEAMRRHTPAPAEPGGEE